MKQFQRFLCLLLSLLLLTGAPLALAEEDAEIEAPETETAEAAEDVELPEELIVGHPTVTKGDFFTEMFGNDTADIDVRALIHGYNLVNWDQNQGVYVFDPSVVKKVGPIEVDEKNNHTYKLILWDDLTYSDGTPITAWDYAFSILLMMSPEIEQIGGKVYRAEHLLGYDDYIKTRKKIMNREHIDDSAEGDVLVLSGVEVIDDYQIWFHLDGDFLPYFFETGLLLTVPYPIDVIAPGCKVYNDGGIYLGNAENYDPNEEPIFTAELLKKTILDSDTGYNSHPAKSSGPYTLVSWDEKTGEGHYQINPYFKGAWYHNTLPGPDYSGAATYVEVVDPETGERFLDFNGDVVNLVKPGIEKITFVVADNDTLIDELAKGNLHLVNKVTYGPTIEKGNQRIKEREEDDKYGILAQNYNRIGLAFLTFTYDWPTVHDKEVRQAIAWCMDRDLLTEEYCGKNNALRVDGYYGIEQWEYQLLTRRIDYPINLIGEDPLPTVQVDKDGNPIDVSKKYHHKYVRTDAEYEAALAAWDALADEWTDKLTKYTVNLKRANDLLDDAGWTLNRDGGKYEAGKDDVRCKMVNGELVALDLKMMYPDGNHMAEIMQTAVRDEENKTRDEDAQPVDAVGSFTDNLAAVGIKLEMVPTPMTQLLQSYYRQTERTTDMIYLATNFHVIVDPSITYSTDSSENHEIWKTTYSDDQLLYDMAVQMRQTEPGDVFEYVSEWSSFQKRYNEVLPTIPIYSNVYYDFYNEYLQNYWITGQVTWSQAIVPAYFALEGYEMPEPEEAEDGNETFDD